MELFQKVFQNEKLRIIDHTNVTSIFHKPFEAQASFAIEDAIATVVGQRSGPPTIRLWLHDPTLVLGIPDARLTNLAAGVRYMQELDYDVIIRNSGGLAVLLDRNVLNISFILPNKDKLSINEGYDLMYFFTRQLFASEQAEILAYEIKGSYCPGDYDLSIDGKKFAGISQRRVRQGVAVQMYLDIAGSSYKRATIVKQFYDLARGERDKFTYPDVNPEVMASINELLGKNFTVKEISNRIKQQFLDIAQTPLERNLLKEEEALFYDRLKQMHKRNEVLTTMRQSM